MPSSKYENLTLGATGSTYTAPANGWFVFRGTGTTASANLSIYVGEFGAKGIAGVQNTQCNAYIFALKGQTATIFYDPAVSSPWLHFHYAEGSK